MSLIEEVNTIIVGMGIPVESGAFTSEPPDEYAVLTPLIDTFALNADDMPGVEIQEVRISLYSKCNPRPTRNRIVRALLRAGITITNRAYIEFEPDTRLHHDEIDVAKHYMWDEESEE